jgi:hypothetical protein
MSSSDALLETLEFIRQRIKDHRALYEQNEAAVSMQVITPILRALGWSVEEPNEVQPNVSTEEGRPDYTLIHDGKKRLFVEVKKLSIDVEKIEPMRQLSKYAFGEGIKYGLLTNGSLWVLVRSFEEGTTLSERIVWRADIEAEELQKAAKKLLTLSKANISQIEDLVRKAQILDEVWHSLCDEPSELVQALIPVYESLLASGYPQYHFDRLEIEEHISEAIREITSGPSEPGPGPAPGPESESRPSVGRSSTMTLQGEAFKVHWAYDFLVNTANWLIKRGKLKSSDCPVAAGHRRNLVNVEPKHKHGDPFRTPKKLEGGLYLETHWSRTDCIKHARRLLERFGYSPQVLEIRD